MQFADVEGWWFLFFLGGAGGMRSLPFLARPVLEGRGFVSFSWVGFFVACFGHFFTKRPMCVRPSSVVT